MLEYISNIEVFNIKINHFIIFDSHTAAQNSTLPGGKIEYRLVENTCPLKLTELSIQDSLWLFSLEGETQARVCGSLPNSTGVCQAGVSGTWTHRNLSFLWLCDEPMLRNALVPAAFPPG